ncbi:MAG: VanZ family protein [Anaerolineaceae bacterium]
MKSIISRWLPVILWAALIFIGSMNHDPYRVLPTALRQPLQVVGITLTEDDLFGKPGHLIEYAILGALVTRALIWKRSSTPGLFALALVFCAAYALSDEIHQTFVAGRTFQLQDLGIDIAGIIIGLPIYWLFNRKRVKHHGSNAI